MPLVRDWLTVALVRHPADVVTVIGVPEASGTLGTPATWVYAVISIVLSPDPARAYKL